MRRYMLDTNTVSYFIKDQFSTLGVKILSVPMDSLYISVFTEAELLHGLAKKASKGSVYKLEKLVREFLAHVTILPWDSEAAYAYVNLRIACEKNGKSLSVIDMLIGAHSVANEACLVSSDKAFFHLTDILDLEDWTKP